MNLICKSFTLEEFKKYIETISFKAWRPSFIVVHNTDVPNQELYKSWHNKPNWTMEKWGKNLASYYTGMGWKGCPHLFVGYDKILVLNDLTFPGTHSPSWNKYSWGVETIGNFEKEPFDNGVKDNLIGALAALHEVLGLNPNTIKFHKEDVNTTHKTCPGRNIVKEKLILSVAESMKEIDGHIHVTETAQEADTVNLTLYEATSINWLQDKLNYALKLNLKIDGILGPHTKEAVRQFQQLKKLKVDGIAGPITRLALLNYSRWQGR